MPSTCWRTGRASSFRRRADGSADAGDGRLPGDREIRADERFADLPIVAMTAHATIEERQRCLAAGMNDHISKPIDPGMLFEVVGRFYRPAGPAEPAKEISGAGSARGSDELPLIQGLDTREGLARVAGNRKLYLKLLHQFVEQQRPAIGQITAALTAGDAKLAERIAHTLKGVAGNLGAKELHAAAGALEKRIRDRASDAELDGAKRQLAAVLDPCSRRSQVRRARSAPLRLLRLPRQRRRPRTRQKLARWRRN
jgi:HPt (histidine-containing phosphotransfer) domain-containing protein